MSVSPMNHPAHSSSHHSSHAAAYYPVLSLLLCNLSAIVLIFQFTSHQLFAQLHSISSKLSPLAFVGIYSTPFFCRHCSSIDLYIPCDLDLSTGFLIFSWLACVDSIYLLMHCMLRRARLINLIPQYTSLFIHQSRPLQEVAACHVVSITLSIPVRGLFQISRDCTPAPRFMHMCEAWLLRSTLSSCYTLQS
jgi:hypothetical protein